MDEGGRGVNRNVWVVVVLLLITLGYFHEYILFGTGAHVRVHDNLDSDVVYRHHLAHEGMVFASPMEPVEPVMDGLPRVCLPSGINFMVWIYAIFGTFGGFVVSEFVVHALAYIGMLLLLRNHFLRDDKYWLTRHLMALFFATMAYFPVSGGAVVLQPFLLNAILHIRNSGKIRAVDVISIAAFPLYSSFVWAGLFVVILLGGIWLHAMLQKGFRQSMALLGAVTLLVVFSVIADYQLFLTFFFPEKFFVHHRTEFQIAHDYNYRGVILMAGLNALSGIYHSASFMGWGFALAPLVAFFVYFFGKEKAHSVRPLVISLIVWGFVAMMSTFWFWDQLDFIYQKGSIFNQVNLSRFHYLLPLSGMVALACSIVYFFDNKLLRYGLFVGLVASSIWNYKLYYDLHHIMPRDYLSNTTYRDFFSEQLFSKIRQDCEAEMAGQDFRVVTLGMEPSALQYNGFKTLDSYQNLFPLAYKYKFHSIMVGELAKCSNLTSAFVNGSNNKCYLFSCEMEARIADYEKGIIKHVNELLIDPDAMLALNGRFVISRIEIRGFGTDRIKEWRRYIDPTEKVYKEIYIYKVF